MQSKEHLAPICETLSTTASEAQWNLRMCIPTLKEETVECLNEEVSPCSEDTYPSEPFESPEYVNYYDSMGFKVEKLEKEFPEDEHPQLDFSINCTIIPENKELLELIDKQEVNHENTERKMSLIINEENANGNYQFIVKMEKPEEDKYVLDNAGATSVQNDVLMNSQEVEYQLRLFGNGINLLTHNTEHGKVEINKSGDSDVIELHQRQYGDKSFNNHDNVLAHVGDVHTKNIPKGKLGGKHFKSDSKLKRCVELLHKQMSLNQVTGNSMKCKYCNVDYKYKDVLYKHMEQCRTDKEVEEMKYKCDSCEGTYRSKRSLNQHVKRTHYDYGRTFDCWCGKQFRTPLNLSGHLNRQHDGKINDTNNDKLACKEVEEIKYKCDLCEGTFRNKYSLTQHIKSMHYDYGRTFDCWCGKQFRTPRNLGLHLKRKHGGKMKDTNNDRVQCDTCQRKLKSKAHLLKHIKNVHYDYNKVFECWCGKQFRTPIYLRKHMRRTHDGKMKDRTNDKV